MGRFIDNINFFVNVQKIAWKGFWTYREQFIFWTIANSLVILNSFIAITVIYSISSGIPGWSYFQVLALSGITTMAIGVIDYLISPLAVVDRLRTGKMDMWFTKPYSYLVIVSSCFGNVTPFASVISGLALFTYAAMHLGLQTVQFVYFALLFVAGVAAFLMFFVMMAVLSYHLFRSGEFIESMEGLLENAGRYPLSVYGILGQFAFTLAMPIGVAYYYPAEALFGTLSPVALAAAAVLSITIMLVSRKIFYTLLKNYSSGGG